MSQASPVDDALRLAELSEELAEAAGRTAEAIEDGVKELWIASPGERDGRRRVTTLLPSSRCSTFGDW